MSAQPRQPKQVDLDVYAVPVLNDPTDDRTGKNTDLSTFTRHEWSHALCQTNDHGCDLLECKYGWCSCFVMAQIESRIGMSSYNQALCFHAGALMITLVPTLVLLVWVLFIASDSAEVSSSSTMAVAISTVVVLVITVFVVYFRMVAMRSAVRKMFDIPEGTISDCFAMRRRRNVRALRQMTLHLKIDQAGIFDRVDTLPAYES
ncbi:hypothetical protein Gpo141_00013026 [Globisporangium polare]